MAGYTIGKTAQTDPNTVGDDIATALTAGNATIWFAPIHARFDSADGKKRFHLLESTSAVDDYISDHPDQKYRLLLVYEMDPAATNPTEYTKMTMYMGNDLQISANAPVNPTNIILQAGVMEMVVFQQNYRPSKTSEFNWRISFTDRGFAMAMWKTSYVNRVGNRAAGKIAGNFSCVVQRPVNPSTGLPKVSGNAPIFALWHGADFTAAQLNSFRWGIVREQDNSASQVIGFTDEVSRYNMYRLTMDWSHPNLFDNNSHVVKFPYGLATNSHLYLDELDMMCLVSASAFASQQQVGITMYGESSERKYTTGWGEVLYGNIVGVQQPQPKIVSGARIGILTQNGGI